MDNIQQQDCTRSRTVEDSSQAKAETKNVMSSLAHTDNNMTVRKRSTIEKPVNEDLKEMPL